MSAAVTIASIGALYYFKRMEAHFAMLHAIIFLPSVTALAPLQMHKTNYPTTLHPFGTLLYSCSMHRSAWLVKH
jgi:hypothetical protein